MKSLTRPVEHLVDCDADPFVPNRCDAAPFVPNGWSVAPDSQQLPNRARGIIRLGPAPLRLYLTELQREERNMVIRGFGLLKKLANKPVLGANVLDYLWANKRLIPRLLPWLPIYNSAVFWGTLYYDHLGRLCVRCLLSRKGGPELSHHLVDGDWDGSDPAVLRARLP